ncbi:MAG: hypothetical protein LIO86_10820 [Lachnospiraceae bacterium]|nr:hypothetical protein [Lachnospiraceae bacterium]
MDQLKNMPNLENQNRPVGNDFSVHDFFHSRYVVSGLTMGTIGIIIALAGGVLLTGKAQLIVLGIGACTSLIGSTQVNQYFAPHPEDYVDHEDQTGGES